MSHTRGPLHVTPNDEGAGLVIHNEDMYWLAVTKNDGQDDDEERANARLFAAAFTGADSVAYEAALRAALAKVTRPVPS